MAFRFTSRQGETFFLHARQEARSDGRTELVHYFASEVNPAEAVNTLPAGYSVVEEADSVRLVRSATAERHQARLQTMADPRARREAKRAARRERFETRTRPAKIDWMALALGLGVDPDAGTVTDEHARGALDAILGEENIRAAVELRLGFHPGWNVAEGVLRLMRSELATDLAYEAYSSSTGDRAVQAVALVKEIGHPKALGWMEEFLRDEHVAGLGAELLGALVSRQAVDDGRVERLLTRIEENPNAAVRDTAASIRQHLGRHEAGDRRPS